MGKLKSKSLSKGY